MRFPLKCNKIIYALIGAVVIVALALTLYFVLRDTESANYGAVVTNGVECSKIGVNIMAQGGSVADAAIATLFCEGIACPQSMGLGGGLVLTIYSKSTNTVKSLVSRERAPLDATQDMLVNVENKRGGVMVAVPGELKGYAELYNHYGSLPWKTLIQPTIDLCNNGITVTPYLGRILRSRSETIYNEPSLREVFWNENSNSTYVEGEKLKRPTLARTLEIIANEGADAMYNGSLTDQLVADIQANGGIIRKEDFNSYEARWGEPLSANLFNGKRVLTTTLPSSGILLVFIINILSQMIDQQSEAKFNPVTYQRIIESFKYAYAKRSDLGDMDYEPSMIDVFNNLTKVEYAEYIRSLIRDDFTSNEYSYYGANFSMPEDHGTAHISVLHPSGDAISVTSTINTLFGAKFRSTSTGIIFNDEMDDFSTPGSDNHYGVPPSPSNYIKPQKMPMSSMTPAIVLDKDNNVELIIGGAGGTKITTQVAYVLLRYFYFQEDLETAMTALRIHHQLAPMTVEYEQGFDPSILEALRNIGHTLEQYDPDSGFASLTAIAVEAKNQIAAVFDERRSGSATVMEF